MFSANPNMREFARILLNSPPAAHAWVQGDAAHRGLHGTVRFYPALGGTLVAAEIHGLPAKMPSGVFAFHIHDGKACRGNAEDPFAAAGSHFNPAGREHPYHAGDLPPLFSNNGFAFLAVYTGRFTPEDVVGRTVILHGGVEDFTSQPAGNAGKKIACGEIRKG